MPAIIAIDVSLSMARQIVSPDSDSSDLCTYLQLAIHGTNSLLDYFSAHAKLEFVALTAFSSTCEVISPFTRDFESLRSKLTQLEECDKTCFDSVVQCVNRLVLSEWGSSTPCQVILLTDGNLGMSSITIEPPVFSFPCKLTSVIISKTKSCHPSLKKLVETPDTIPFTKMADLELSTWSMSSTISVLGFLEISQIGSPAAVSRHLVLPQESGGNGGAPPVDHEEEGGEGNTPSFCVLLHGAVKVENYAALCNLGSDWYGILYSCADSKKKSNLMLLALEPGKQSVPWLGNLQHLVSPDLWEHVEAFPLKPLEKKTFPLKPLEKKSYSLNAVNWIRQASLQSDIQKILRHARKLPDKTVQFYKELNKLKRAAISYGFLELFDGLAAIFERECTLLPGTAHPDCALQLTFAAGLLRKPYVRDPKYVISAMRTNFNNEDE
ncbi:integrator complex subunit 14 [Diaphorina citri]|uniref:Integrator complex subunit 14 n=1 Tax=Diaphorina citri TaxID=121845 RepID=A0A3Q0JDC0_DIACI|nr:integrator complex subunit 14 [Diaphorina citri]